MAKKIHLSITLCNFTMDRFHTVQGANSRNLLQGLYADDFCLQTTNWNGEDKKTLITRDEVTNMSSGKMNGMRLPSIHTFGAQLFAEDVLYVHQSVISRLADQLEHWENVHKFFDTELGIAAPAHLMPSVKTLLNFVKETYDEETPFAVALLIN